VSQAFIVTNSGNPICQLESKIAIRTQRPSRGLQRMKLVDKQIPIGRVCLVGSLNDCMHDVRFE
jgi:hypothetical protein